MASCSSKSTTAKKTSGYGNTSASGWSRNNNQSTNNANRTMIFGKVDSIIGNQVTLILAKNSSSTASSNASSTASSNNSNSQNQNKTQSLSLGTTQEGGMGGQWQGQRRSSSSSQSFKLSYTGEKKEITIPVGVPITEMKTVNGTRQQKEVDLSDIEEGSILSITMENNFITQVRIQGTASSSSSSQSTEGFGDMGGGMPGPGGN